MFDIWLIVAIVIDRILVALGLFVCALGFFSWFVVLLLIVACVLILLVFAVRVWLVVYLLSGSLLYLVWICVSLYNLCCE